MKLTSLQAAFGSALLVLMSQQAEAHGAHQRAHLNRKHHHGHSHQQEIDELVVDKRTDGSVKCAFPNTNELHRVPGEKNRGWAMSPDQECLPGNYCPIACPPGKVMAQWEDNSTYTYPSSMNGGLYCDYNGDIHKPFDDKPYCVDGTGAVQVINKCGKALSCCQTVLPGNEAMLIPTVVKSTATLAVPDINYWCSTSAHFYVNPPGVGEEGCIWGDPSKPIGNWAAYVAGANTVASGQTFVTLGYNPIWEGSDLKNTKPTYAVKIECPGGGCNGTPCAIDPSKNPIGKVTSDLAGIGAGNSAFCVVTVPPGGTANIVVYDISGAAVEEEEEEEAEPEPEPETTKKATPTPTPTPSTTSTTSTSTKTSSKASSKKVSSTAQPAIPTVIAGIFHENDTATIEPIAEIPTTTAPTLGSEETTEAAPTTSKPSEGVKQGGAAIVGLIVAFVAAAFLY